MFCGEWNVLFSVRPSLLDEVTEFADLGERQRKRYVTSRYEYATDEGKLHRRVGILVISSISCGQEQQDLLGQRSQMRLITNNRLKSFHHKGLPGHAMNIPFVERAQLELKALNKRET